MVATWPTGLPEYVQSGATEKPQEERIESPNADQGQPARRRRIRGRVREFEGSIVCTGDEVATFRTFYETTLVFGCLPFNWVNPRTQAAGVFRFQLPPPSYTPRTHDAIVVAFRMIQVR